MYTRYRPGLTSGRRSGAMRDYAWARTGRFSAVQHARALSRTTTKLQPTVSILSLKFATSGGLDLEAQ